MMGAYFGDSLIDSRLLLLKLVGVFLLFGMTILTLLAVSGSTDWSLLEYPLNQATDSSQQVHDETLPSGSDGGSCHSRYDSLLHKHSAIRKPSADLISKLKSYESLHKHCGPSTYLYTMSTNALKSNTSRGTSECKYIIYIASSGLGNKMIALASTFLYALLTDRILLIEDQEFYSLFCEPFPNSSWLLPSDFPLYARLHTFHKESKESFGKLLRNNLLGNSSSSLPHPYVYLHLDPTFGSFDKRFYCDEDHSYIHDVPWLILWSNQYFVPSLFSITSFEKKLHDLFPDKETVFHFLASYLFNPEDSVWGLVRRFYDAYLSDADFKLGIQIRTNTFYETPFQDVLSLIVSCTTNEGLLPSIYPQEQGNLTKYISKRRKIVVLLTSLSRDYFEHIRKMFWEDATVTGETIAVHQPSFEENQKVGNLIHEQKALAEMYLLSLSDELVTSPSSTFGYVAQGLGGLKPWMILMSKNKTGHYHPCRRLPSMEPCFHVPPYYNCKTGSDKYPNSTEPHTTQCLDGIWGLGGLQLVNNFDNPP